MKILVAVDLSDQSSIVVEAARQLAAETGAKVWLIHVAAPDPAFVGYDVGPQYERDAAAKEFRQEHVQIQTIADSFRAAGIDATALLIQGMTSETIVSEADRLKAGMIIVGSHGGGIIRNLLVGSISEGVLRNAKCPVLVVPNRKTE